MKANEERIETKQTRNMDRREFIRHPPKKDFVIVRTHDGTTTAGRIENVSSGGIGLQLEFRAGIEKDDKVDVVYKGGVLPAVVRYIELHDDESVFAGLEWTLSKDDPA